MIVETDGGDFAVRRSLLWVAGTRFETIESVASQRAFGADVVTLDLEDTVPREHKEMARESVSRALREIDFGTTERAVRINGPGSVGALWFREDIVAIVPARPHFIRLPKVDSVVELKLADDLISEAERDNDLSIGTTKLVVHIENPLAVRNAYELATASERVIGLVMSGEDYTESIRARRHTRGPEYEMLYARGKVLVDARAAGGLAFDSVYMDVADNEGFREEATLARQIGFDGKNCLTPEQVSIANEVFAPDHREVDFARRAVAAFDAAIHTDPEDDGGAGTGVLPYLDGQLIGPPVALKARLVVTIADALGL